MNRKQRRAAAKMLSREEFERELRAVVEGRPADPSVAKFWDHFASTGRVAASAVGDGGIEILRTGKGGER
ncbi:hypothetical protein GCM10010528_23160 [Gordonia defluvii]|uniref:Uncharacterized protein n=1 Tax=Gordonia defluvii TaxID=283718 RepID=A0ABP6LJQ8_9ACTN